MAGIGALSVCALTVWGLIEGLAAFAPSPVLLVTTSIVLRPYQPSEPRPVAQPHLARLSPVVPAPPFIPPITPNLMATASPNVTRPPTTGPQAQRPAPATERPPAPPPSPPQDYLSRLVAHLNAYKHYPYDAQLRHEQGTVRLHFIMDRMGYVKSYQVVGSSGFPALDDEARAVIRNAQPLPPVPPDYPGTTLDLVLPLVFSLH